MAITTVNLNDPVSTLVTKTNEISSNLGDVSNLFQETNAVDAINAVNTNFQSLVDSNYLAIEPQARGAISVSNDGGITSLSYNEGTGVISIVNSIDSAAIKDLITTTDSSLDVSAGVVTLKDASVGASELVNLSVTNTKLAENQITSSKFNSKRTLSIYDSTGSLLFSMYSPGS